VKEEIKRNTYNLLFSLLRTKMHICNKYIFLFNDKLLLHYHILYYLLRYQICYIILFVTLSNLLHYIICYIIKFVTLYYLLHYQIYLTMECIAIVLLLKIGRRKHSLKQLIFILYLIKYFIILFGKP